MSPGPSPGCTSGDACPVWQREGAGKEQRMREVVEPPLVRAPSGRSLADMVFANAEEAPDEVVLNRKAGGRWHDVTAARFRDEVVALAKGLVASGVGLGDRVGLLSRNRYEWTLFDYALWAVGAIPVPIYATSSAEQIRWILADAGAVACVVESEEHERAAAARPDLLIWRLDAGAVDALVAAGRGVDTAEVHRRRAAVTPADPATIIYTSGTTGRPKGCVLTHGNFYAEVDNAVELLYPVFRSVSKDPAATLLFLPLAHVFGRMVQVACVRARVRMGHAPSLKQQDLLPDLATFRPTFVLGVPYLFEKVFNVARATAERMGRESSFDRAVEIAVRYGEALERQAHGGPGLRLRLAHRLYDKLVYARIRAAFGGKVRYAISGGSPLGRRLALFYAGAGIVVYEGYGLTETTAAATVNPPLAPRFGTVGRPLPGTAVRIADDGEIWIKGGQVFAGYWNDETTTGEVLHDGWFATGDVGQLDDDGYLTITGRKKELLVTSGGKNVAPAVLEDRVRAHPLVSQCLVVGDQRPYVAALITLDAEAVRHWLTQRGRPADTPLADLVDDPDLLAEVQQAVDEANAAVSRAESIRRFRVLPVDFTEDAGFLTPSLKPKREVIGEAFRAEIESLYSG
ncbi:AMP-dependent synthetase/ligase [Carbonactinospora thermoautotrophica]|uniref:AMP-dependent synthetase/ligase n=1 Tax=Carbonactinospora thermoautotrophica TaxID=1469144 RepID=UPI003DA9D215